MNIELTQGKTAIIDDEDYPVVSKHSWFAQKQPNGRWYAVAKINGKSVRLHTLLTGAKLCDHKDLDGLNNRRLNLRPCSNSQNLGNQRLRSNNKSGFKGVIWHKDCKKWMCSVRGKYIGLFDTPQAAAVAYDNLAEEQFGEFALTNQSLGLL